MDERASFGAAEHLQPPTGLGTTPAAAPGASLADPRALTILSTEHWSLLSARSLVYNESFARTGMFLTFLSASTVALALVAQAMGFDREFLLFATAILGFDLFIALATLGRIESASSEDLRSIQGMNRIRHAYLEIAPGLKAYFISSTYDDMPGILSTYGESSEGESIVGSAIHGLTTMPGMVAAISAALGGLLGAVLALDFGAAPGVAALIGLASGVLILALALATGMRGFTRFNTGLDSRFPTPPET